MKYTVTCNNRSYEVTAAFGANLDTVWASQRSFFMTGTKVVVADENGNSKEFVK